jgi:hypothetical protein
VRVSTADRGQTVENQLQPLQEAAGRLGWSLVASTATGGSVALRAAPNNMDWTICSKVLPGETSTSWRHGT